MTYLERCYDCSTPTPLEDMEGTCRAGKFELVCIECYVTSGDDNFHSWLRHEKERHHERS